MENTVFCNIEEEVSSLADVSKDKNETEEFLSAESFYEADDITEHVDDSWSGKEQLRLTGQ